VVNWGSSTHPKWLEDPRFRLEPVFLNHGDRVKEAIDKLAFFRKASKIDGIPLLRWTTERSQAEAWIGKGKSVIARTTLRGSSGEGIVLINPGKELIEAPLYTRYYPKTHEFRVHVFDGRVIDFTQKRFKGGKDARSIAGERTIVRSHSNGWVHTHGDLELIEDGLTSVSKTCCNLISELGLVFGAVDVMAILEPPDADCKRRLRNYVICEVNTGPGLENTQTIEAYKTAILSMKTSSLKP
jgi:hypothetical protein